MQLTQSSKSPVSLIIMQKIEKIKNKRKEKKTDVERRLTMLMIKHKRISFN